MTPDIGCPLNVGLLEPPTATTVVIVLLREFMQWHALYTGCVVFAACVRRYNIIQRGLPNRIILRHFGCTVEGCAW